MKNDKYIDSRGAECLGRSRYLNISGDDSAIITKAKKDIERHTEDLIRNISENKQFIADEKQKRVVELKNGRTSESIVLSIKGSLMGYKNSKTKSVNLFKGKKIEVTHDSENTVDDIITP